MVKVQGLPRACQGPAKGWGPAKSSFFSRAPARLLRLLRARLVALSGSAHRSPRRAQATYGYNLCYIRLQPLLHTVAGGGQEDGDGDREVRDWHLHAVGNSNPNPYPNP